jgi:hypothetical protein
MTSAGFRDLLATLINQGKQFQDVFDDHRKDDLELQFSSRQFETYWF